MPTSHNGLFQHLKLLDACVLEFEKPPQSFRKQCPGHMSWDCLVHRLPRAPTASCTDCTDCAVPVKYWYQFSARDYIPKLPGQSVIKILKLTRRLSVLV